mmetsp:Transcript_11833/g.31953  ORF Transcript_11833/g.31953 Transcript_11833/m.31953 type:complete len:88 (+) Transcript_11833:345-608(+)
MSTFSAYCCPLFFSHPPCFFAYTLAPTPDHIFFDVTYFHLHTLDHAPVILYLPNPVISASVGSTSPTNAPVSKSPVKQPNGLFAHAE